MIFREAPWVQQSQPPWSFPGMTLNAFAFRATLASLETWCEQTLNDASDSSFVPALPIVYLCVAQYPKMVVQKHPSYGYSTQNEYFFMLPVIRVVEDILPIELGWAYPFMGVTNATSVVSGQMVLGLPKVYGEITVQQVATAETLVADIAMLALLEHSAGTQQKIEPLIQLRATNPVAGPAAMNFPTGLLNLPGVQALASSDLLSRIEEAIAGDITGVGFGIRQLRDCETPTEAAFTDVVRMRWNASNEQDIKVWQDATIDLFDNATFPITDTLGLVGGKPQPAPWKGTRYRALAGFGTTLDLDMSASSLPSMI